MEKEDAGSLQIHPLYIYKKRKIIGPLGRGELEKLSFILFIKKDGDIFSSLNSLILLIF